MLGLALDLCRRSGFGLDAAYPSRARRPAGGLGLGCFGLVPVKFFVGERASVGHVVVVRAKGHKVPDLVPAALRFRRDVVNVHKEVESANCAGSPVFPVRQCSPMACRVLDLHQVFASAFFAALLRAVLVFPAIQGRRDHVERGAARCARHLNPFSLWVAFASSLFPPVRVPASGAAIAARLHARLGSLKRLFALDALLLDAGLSGRAFQVVSGDEKSFWLGRFAAPASAKIVHSLKRLTQV